MDEEIENIELENILHNEKPKQKEEKPLDVLKELFTEENIRTKTELTDKQISLVNQKRALAKMLGWDRLDEIVSDWMTLQVSRNREGRKEFIDGFKYNRESEQINKNGFISKTFDKIGL